MDEELLDCPRCGGHIGLMSDDHNNPQWWSAHCDCITKFGLLVEIGASTREELVKGLNQRSNA